MNGLFNTPDVKIEDLIEASNRFERAHADYMRILTDCMAKPDYRLSAAINLGATLCVAPGTFDSLPHTKATMTNGGFGGIPISYASWIPKGTIIAFDAKNQRVIAVMKMEDE